MELKDSVKKMLQLILLILYLHQQLHSNSLMKGRLLFIVLFLISYTSMAQIGFIKKLLSNEKDTLRRASFMPVPAFGYTQETGLQFGVGALYAFYADRADTNNSSSNFSITASYATKGTYNFSSYGDAWTKKNRYHILSEIRYRKMHFNFYGLGNHTKERNLDSITQNLFKMKFDLEKNVFGHFYTGVSASFELQHIEDRMFSQSFSKRKEIIGHRGGRMLFLGVSQSYDTRNSNNYPTHGLFVRGTYQYAPNLFGDSHFKGSQLGLNLRNFWELNRKFVLGAQGVYHSVYGKVFPFYVLPQLGNDEIMRGYYTGRYRDQNLMALQSELRLRFNSRFGAVVFAGAGTVWGHSPLNLTQFKPNFGGGLRYFYDPDKGLSVRLDYGIGIKNPQESRQRGFYISLGEAF